MSARPMLELASGALVLGRYRVLRLLARGGMGTVHFGRTEGAAGFHVPVVIKTIQAGRTHDGEAVKLFAREARIMARLKHPNIVAILDFDEQDGTYVMVLEYVHGRNLEVWHRYHREVLDSPFDVEMAVHLAGSVLEALSYAHGYVEQGRAPWQFVHRDVKPSNILIGVDGTVKLADFGIARASGEQTTGEGPTIRGTWAYLAPEIFGGCGPDARTDVYACGVVLHELLAGRNELKGPDPQSTVYNALHHHPTPLDRLRPDVSGQLAAIVDRAIAKDPSSRPASAAELADELRRELRHEARDVQTRLTDAVLRDFHDPRFLGLAGAVDLCQLEHLLEAGADALPTAERGPALPASNRVDLGAVPTAPTAPEAGVRAGVDRTSTFRSARLSLMVLAALTLVGAGFLLLRQRGRAGAGLQRDIPARPVARDPAAGASPRAISSVTLRIEGPPAGTQVIGPDGTVLGTAPGVVRLAGKPGELELGFRIPDGRELRQRVSTATDSTVVVVVPTMDAVGSRDGRAWRAKVPHRDDIEDPFR